MNYQMLEVSPAAVYTTDADGRITFYNEAAAQLWGCRPGIGTSKWCGSWRLFWPDGRPMRHEDCPMAIALREGAPCLGREAVAERPDGTRVPFMPLPAPLKDASGKVVGGINVLVDITDRIEAEVAMARLAAIVASSEDAIVSKTLDGTVTSWNAGAVRIFGYQPDEMIGQSIKRIIPPELHAQEDEILARLRRGDRIEHFDTVRLTKLGERIEISLAISPIRDAAGKLVGASKVARDISERKRNEQLQRLLLDELNHRVKNTLATIQAIASQSMRMAPSPRAFVESFNGRVQALARAHELLVIGRMEGTTLHELVRQQVALGSPDGERIAVSGPAVMLDARIAVQLALVLHELATNARKYGALSVPEGRLSVSWTVSIDPERELCLVWRESGVRGVSAPASSGFGTTLIERSLAANEGRADIRYEAGGLVCEIALPLPRESRQAASDAPRAADPPTPGVARPASRVGELAGRRVLLVEDEPLVAMDMEEELLSLGLEVIGPASNVESAERLIAEAEFDIALVDANLHGRSADRVAAALARKRVPFAFATGYGREALPEAFRDVPILAKPFDSARLVSILLELSPARRPAGVIPLRPAAS